MTAGLSTAWIDRQRLSQGGDWGATAPVDMPVEPDYVFFSLADLVARVPSPASTAPGTLPAVRYDRGS